MKKVLVYCEKWENGGIESYLMNQFRHWDLSQAEYTILSAEKSDSVYDDELDKIGIQQRTLFTKHSKSPILRTVKTFFLLKNFLKLNYYDIAYFNLSNCVQMRYVKIAKTSGISRRIVHSHTAGIRPGITYILKIFSHKIDKKIYSRYATDYWACSEKAAHFLFPSNLQDKVKIIPNGINAEQFRYNDQERVRIRRELGENDETVIIGTVGRCSSEKNHKFLLRVFCNVHRLIENSKLIIVGDGPLKALLQNKAKKLGIKDDCIFYGSSNHVSSLYSAMDIFCLPSITESFGISALEAQATGCVCFLADNIPRKIKILSNTQFLQLKEKQWVEAVVNSIDNRMSSRQRERSFLKVREYGFDISSIANNVQRELMNI